MTPTHASVRVVIVCYQAVDLTVQCLESLEPEWAGLPGMSVAVCENGTGPEAAEALRREIHERGWGDRVELLPIDPNRGFSGGNNAVLRRELRKPDTPDYFLLLNADTIVRPGAMAAMLAAAAREPDAGVVSPRLEWPDGEGQVSCFRFSSPVSEFIDAAHTGPITRLLKRFDVPLRVFDEPTDVAWTSFACALIRGEVMRRVGVLDDGYFLYYDDPDYCRRVWRAGWRVHHAPAARVVHLRGKSNPVKSDTAARRRPPRYLYASRARFFTKAYGHAGLWLANAMWHLGRVIGATRDQLERRPPTACKKQWLDIWTGALRPMRMPPELPDQAHDEIHGRAFHPPLPEASEDPASSAVKPAKPHAAAATPTS